MTSISIPDRRAIKLLTGSSGEIWIATALLFAVSPLIAPGSLGEAPILSMLPFAAVLAIIAAGQTLVIQQRGLDLSVPGMVAMGALLATNLPQTRGVPMEVAVTLAVGVTGLIGVMNGVMVTQFRVMPLVVTLGMNAILLGAVFAISNGTPAGALDSLNQFALNRTLGIPNTVLVATAVIGAVGLLTKKTPIGRQLTAMGVSEAAARALGIRVSLYQTLAYGIAGACYGAGGVLLAGYTKTPALFLGDAYLLPSVAAVVLGGAVLTGGLTSVVSSAVAALFLTQLGQLLRSLGWPDPSQLLAQSAVLVLVVLVRELVRKVNRWAKTRRATEHPTTSVAAT